MTVTQKQGGQLSALDSSQLKQFITEIDQNIVKPSQFTVTGRKRIRIVCSSFQGDLKECAQHAQKFGWELENPCVPVPSDDPWTRWKGLDPV